MCLQNCFDFFWAGTRKYALIANSVRWRNYFDFAAISRNFPLRPIFKSAHFLFHCVKWGALNGMRAPHGSYTAQIKRILRGFAATNIARTTKCPFPCWCRRAKALIFFINSGINAVGTSSRSTAMINGVSFEEFFTTSYIDTSDLACVLSAPWDFANSFASAVEANSAYFINLSFIKYVLHKKRAQAAGRLLGGALKILLGVGVRLYVVALYGVYGYKHACR